MAVEKKTLNDSSIEEKATPENTFRVFGYDTTGKAFYVSYSTLKTLLSSLYAALSHSHTEADISDLDKYSQDEVDALIDAISVPTIVDDLTTGGSSEALSAEQGKTLKGLIDTINSLLTSDETDLDTLQEIVDFIELNRDDLDSLTIASIAGLQAALDAKLEDFNNLQLGDFSTLTISNGAITKTKSLHSVATESSASTDDLTFIGGGSTGDILILRNNNANDVVYKHAASVDGTNNLKMKGGADVTLNEVNSAIMFIFLGGAWIHLLDTSVGSSNLTLSSSTELTISTGSIALSRSQHTIDTESDSSTDDLTTVTGYVEGQLYLLKAASTSRVSTIKSSGNIVLKYGEMELSNDQYILFIGTASGIEEVMRSAPAQVDVIPLSAHKGDLEVESNVNGYPVLYDDEWAELPIIHVDDAPTGSAIEVDILVNGVSVMSTKLTIDAGETSSATAATVAVFSDTERSAGDVVSYSITQVGSTDPGAGLVISEKTNPR